MPRSADPDVRLLVALADDVRLSIVRRLAACDGICACDFTEFTDVSQPTVSHHLRVLREAGVVTAERRGSWIYYRLAPEVSGRLAALAPWVHVAVLERAQIYADLPQAVAALAGGRRGQGAAQSQKIVPSGQGRAQRSVPLRLRQEVQAMPWAGRLELSRARSHRLTALSPCRWARWRFR
jgi:ArsR family transcriptional regulator